ncbi:kinesin-like protein KIF24 [Pelobates fuscus]|uniref:kinesin-like protein KIF24 n=1 Tax=Pelobates fuscus TaxID=191477 RepID=UPI002FE42F3A
MASCLFECLCEADLDKYYPRFIAVGLQKIEELAKITMKDYSRLGVHSMEDRKRLFQLIKIIQSVSEEDNHERTPLQPGCVYLHPSLHRSATRRQLHFDSSFEMDRNVCAPSKICGLSDTYSLKRPGELFEMHLVDDQHHTGKIPTLDIMTSCRAKDHNPKTCSVKSIGLSTVDSDAPIIHRVTHVSGYNYGVPQTCSRSSASEKDGPWTETDKIRVCVRKRPLGLREERRGELNVVTVENNETILIHERKEAVNLKEYILQHVFYFDEVFSETFSNQDVYMKTAHPLIQHVFNGGNATCFAYGQTGAGKTYTMIGTQKNPGLYALAAKDIFQLLEAEKSIKDCSIWISFYEIYCGQLYDLLNGRKRLFAREDGKHVVQVVGLREVQVRSVELLLEMILKGSKERSTGATGVNSDSSRSHAIIQIQIKGAGNRKMGRISFIDLAGSERASDARESDKQTKMEGAEINQSLLALKECIRALDQEQAHTPFRQSKLTQVLKDSFIGNSKTCMIANISPSHIATEHTLNTLRYADRVKELKKMKSATCVSRARAPACLSPKRVQNSPSVLGEKISPKKVKLGQQSTSNTTKSNPCSSVFHPNNIPLSSTPKTHIKVNSVKANQAWLNHTTPLKGIINLGNIVKKKNDILLNNKNPVGIKTEIVSPLKGTVQEDPITCYQQPISMQRIQAVPPVQKQIVSRTTMSFGDHKFNTPMHDVQNIVRQAGTDPGNLGRQSSQQKEREQHLRSYHQQFQHPPILQHKLHYQPLEKIFELYNPQEIRVENNRSPLPQSPCEGALLEDLDDSDFSEDSFSYASTNKKGEKRETACERLSFFLHDGSPGLEIRKPKQADRLSFNYEDSEELNQCDAWKCGNTFVSSDGKVDKCAERESFWNSEDDSCGACESSEISNTPEKPYSSQEDPISNLKKTKHLLSTNNTANDITGHLIDSSSLQETGLETKESRKCESEKTEETCDHQRPSSGSGSGLMAPLTLSLLQDNWSMELIQQIKSPESSDRQSSGENNLNCDKVWTVGTEIETASDRHNERSPESNLFGFLKQMLQQNELGESLSGSHSGSNSLISIGSPQLCKGHRRSDKIPREGNVRPFSLSKSSNSLSRDSSIDFAVGQCRENQASPYYEADTEDSTVKIKNKQISPKYEELAWNKSSTSFDSLECTSGPNAVIKNGQPKSSNPELGHIHQPKSDVDVEKKSFKEHFKLTIKDSELEHLKSTLIKCIFSNGGVGEELLPSCGSTSAQNLRNPTDGSSQTQQANLHAKHLEKAQQLVVKAHREQLDEIAALSSKEEILLSQFPHLDFKEYVAKLDEILVLKSKCIYSMRAQLQLFMAYPQTAKPANRTSAS